MVDKQKEVEGVDYVVCQICGKHFKMLNATHLKKHNINIHEYKILYPQSLTICSEMIKRRRNTLVETLSDPIIREKWSNVQIERYMDPLEREKTGIAMLKHHKEHPETAIKIGKGVTETLSNPIVRKRYIDGQNKRFENQKEREKISIERKIYWDEKTDEFKKRHAILISCTKQGISIEEFNGFLYTNDRDHRDSSPAYKDWRKAVITRDNNICQECGTKIGVKHIHHILPYRDYPDPQFSLNPKNGITLCVKCHRKTFGKEYEYFNKYFDKANGIRQTDE